VTHAPFDYLERTVAIRSTAGPSRARFHLLEPFELRGNSVNPARALMTANEVAVYLKVHRSRVYQLMKRNGLPSFRVGWEYRFRRADIDEWIRARKKASSKKP
jgi:excisionase family DNA binding protein